MGKPYSSSCRFAGTVEGDTISRASHFPHKRTAQRGHFLNVQYESPGSGICPYRRILNPLFLEKAICAFSHYAYKLREQSGRQFFRAYLQDSISLI
jgi:hypothetical protein